VTLTKDDLRRGMQALIDALGRDKAELFIAAAQNAKQQPQVNDPVSRWVRDNPLTAVAGAVLVGASFDAIWRQYTRPRRAPPAPEGPAGEPMMDITALLPPPPED